MKQFKALGVALVLVLPAAVQADEPGFHWSRATLMLIDSGDVQRGAEAADKHRCHRCHGEAGISDDTDYPSIAGQVAAYQFKQLVDYKSGARDERDMQRATRKLTPEEMADLAAFYSAQPAASPRPGLVAPALVTHGDLNRMLLPCNVCHGREGQGYGYETPALMGQSAGYFLNTLLDYRNGDRHNDEYGRMRFIATQLTEEEIRALSEYYAAVPADE